MNELPKNLVPSQSIYYSHIAEFPPELWTKIFLNLMDDGKFIKSVATLSHVCRQWNELVKNRKFVFIRPLKKIPRHLNFFPIPPLSTKTSRQVLVSEKAFIIFEKGASLPSDSITPVSFSQDCLQKLEPFKRVNKVVLFAGHLLAVIGKDTLKIFDLDQGLKRVTKQKLEQIINPLASIICGNDAQSDKFAFTQTTSENIWVFEENVDTHFQVQKPIDSFVKGISISQKFVSLLVTQTVPKPNLFEKLTGVKKSRRNKHQTMEIDKVFTYSLENRSQQPTQFCLEEKGAKSIKTDGSCIVVQTRTGFWVNNNQKNLRIPFLTSEEMNLSKSGNIIQFELKDHLLVAARGEKGKEVDLVTWDICTGLRLSTISLDSFVQMDIKWNIAAVIRSDRLIQFWKITNQKNPLKETAPIGKHSFGEESSPDPLLFDKLSLKNLQLASAALKTPVLEEKTETILSINFVKNDQLIIQTSSGVYTWNWTHKTLVL